MLTEAEIMETEYLNSNLYPADTVLPEPVIYKDFGEIYRTEAFSVHVLLRDASNRATNRDYQFMLRSFSPEKTIIDSYVFSSWVDHEQRYCYGAIDNDLIIERTCDEGTNREVRQLSDDGRFIATSYHGTQ